MSGLSDCGHLTRRGVEIRGSGPKSSTRAQRHGAKSWFSRPVGSRQKLTFSGQSSTCLIDGGWVAAIGRVVAARTSAFALLLGELGLAAAIAAALKDEDLDVVGESVDEGDGARGIGEDGVPVLEGQVGGDEQGAVLVAAADELEEEVGGASVVGEVSELVADE